MKGLDGCFFKCEAVLSARKLLLSVATSMNYLNWISGQLAAASVCKHLLLHLSTLFYGDSFLPFNLVNQLSASFQTFLLPQITVTK